MADCKTDKRDKVDKFRCISAKLEVLPMSLPQGRFRIIKRRGRLGNRLSIIQRLDSLCVIGRPNIGSFGRIANSPDIREAAEYLVRHPVLTAL